MSIPLSFLIRKKTGRQKKKIVDKPSAFAVGGPNRKECNRAAGCGIFHLNTIRDDGKRCFGQNNQEIR